VKKVLLKSSDLTKEYNIYGSTVNQTFGVGLPLNIKKPKPIETIRAQV